MLEQFDPVMLVDARDKRGMPVFGPRTLMAIVADLASIKGGGVVIAKLIVAWLKRDTSFGTSAVGLLSRLPDLTFKWVFEDMFADGVPESTIAFYLHSIFTMYGVSWEIYVPSGLASRLRSIL